MSYINTVNIQNYEILEEIGKGSYGKVFKIVDKKTKKIYAVKTMRKKSDELLRSFYCEVNLLSKLNHPCILSFIGFSHFGFDQHTPSLFLQYASNGSLYKLLQHVTQYKQKLIWNSTKILCNLYGIASAMSYLHSNNIIHHDLKIENILEDDYLFPLICDFGLSKDLSQSKNDLLMIASGIKGTITHIAPEVYKNYEYSKAGDVYSYSHIIYSIFTNEELYLDFSQSEFIQKVVYEGYRPEMSSKIPLKFQLLIRRCWAENPNERPTFNEIVLELKEDSDYIFEGVDREQYLNYVHLIESYQTSFDSNQPLNNVENHMIESFEKADFEQNPIVNENVDYSSLFNELINSSLNIENYKPIPIGTNNIIQKIIQDMYINPHFFHTITISDEQIRILFNEKMLDSLFFINFLKFFYHINFNVKFDSCEISEILKTLDVIKKKMIERIKVSVFISNINVISNKLMKNLAISEIIMDNSVSCIENKSFGYCIYLKNIFISSNVKIIEDSTFRLCEKLENVSIPSSITAISSNVFRGCHSIKSIIIPSSVIEIGKSTFRGCCNLKHIVLPLSLRIIERGLFKGCIQLEEIIIPFSVISIKESSFEECLSLSKVSFPSSLKLIDKNAFKDCINLSCIVFDPTMIKIHKEAFKYCKNLTKIIYTSNQFVEFDLRPFPFVTSIQFQNQILSYYSTSSDKSTINVPFSSNSLGELGIDSCTNI